MMCYGWPAKSLDQAKQRLTPEQWARFEREFDDFCVVQGLPAPSPLDIPSCWAFQWARWAFFQGRQYRVALLVGNPVQDARYERLAIAMMSDEQAQMSLERWMSYEGMRRGK